MVDLVVCECGHPREAHIAYGSGARPSFYTCGEPGPDACLCAQYIPYIPDGFVLETGMNEVGPMLTLFDVMMDKHVYARMVRKFTTPTGAPR